MPSNSKYQMWLLRDNGSARIPFPVLPERYSVTYGENTQSVSILGLGEVAMKGDPNAMRVQFEGLFPSKEDKDLVEAYVPDAMKNIGAMTWKLMFDACFEKEQDDILQLNIVGTPVNMFCYCSAYSIVEGDEAAGTLRYSMEFTEYKLTKMELVTIDPITQQAELPPRQPARLDTRVAPASVEIKPGDSLASIARQVYGDENMANALYENNRDLLSNPQLIKAGTTLKMPL